MTAPTLAEVQQWPATVDVRKAALALGISKSTAYEWIRTNQFPVAVISRGHRYVVITAGLIHLLSQTEAGPAA